MDVSAEATSGFDTGKHANIATDFEGPDCWDEGEAENDGPSASP